MIYKKSVVAVVSEYELRLKNNFKHIIDYEKILSMFEKELSDYRKSKRENFMVEIKHSFLFGLIDIKKRVFLRAPHWKTATLFATMSKKQLKKNTKYQKYLAETKD